MTTRRFLRRALVVTGVAALLAGIALALLHTDYAKERLRRYVVRTLVERVGGELTVGSLDYDAFAGEASVTDATWSSADGALVVEGARASLRFSRARPLSATLDIDHIRVGASESAGGTVEIPKWLLETETRLSIGRLSLDLDPGGEVTGLEAEMTPGLGRWTGSVRAATFAYAEAPEFTGVSAEVAVGTRSLEVRDLSADGADGLNVTGSARVDAFEPLTATAEVELRGDAALIDRLAPDAGLAGTLGARAELALDGGSLTGTVELAGDELRRGPIGVARVRLPLTIEPDRVRLTAGELAALDGRLELDGVWDLERSEGSLDARVRSLAVPGAEHTLDGTIRLSVTEAGVESAEGVGSFEVSPMPDAPVPLNGELQLRLRAGELALESARLEGHGVRLDASGPLGETLDLELAAVVGGLGEWTRSVTSVPVDGSLRFRGRATGPWRDPRVDGALTSDELRIADEALSIAGKVSLRGREIVVTDARLSTPEDRRLNLEGSYDLERALVSLRAASEGFTVPLAPELSAELRELDVAVDGPLDGLSGRASAQVEPTTFRGVSFPGARVDAELREGAVRIDVSDSTGEGLARVRLEARSPFPVEGRIDLGRLPAGELLAELASEPEARLEVAGSLLVEGTLAEIDGLAYRAEIDSAVGRYLGVGFGVGAPFELVAADEQVTLRGLTLVGADTAVGVEGTIPLDRSGQVSVTASGVSRLELLEPLLPIPRIAGAAELSLTVTGRADAPRVAGSIRLAEMSAELESIRIEDARAAVRFDDDELVVETLEAGIESSAAPGTQAQVAASGRLQWSSLEPSTWRGEGRLDRVEGFVSGIEIVTEPASWTLADGELLVPSVTLSSGITSITLGGSLRGPDPWSWRARARGAIEGASLAPLLQERGVGLSGAANIDVTASSSAEPPVQGTISMRDGRLSLREPPAVLTALDVELRIDGDRVELARLSANVGGGTLRGDGELRLDGASIASADLGLVGKSVRLRYPEGLRSLVDGTVRLTGTGEKLTLSGDIALDRAVFSRDINLQTEVLQAFARQRRALPTAALTSGIGLDVRLRSREGIRVDNNLAQLQASASLEVKGTVAAPELSGTVTSRPGGEFRLGRNLYRIESGRIDLAGYPSTPPTLDIRARTEVADYDVRMNVSGPADNVITSIAGTSRRNGAAISRADAASLLVTGRTMEKVSGEGRAILGEQLTSFAGSALADLATLGLSESFPIRVRTGDPGLITGESNPSALFIVEAGVTQDLSVGYGVGLNDAERQIWLVDYYLPRSMRTQLIRQTDDEFTGALSQQLQFGGSRARFDEERAAGALISQLEVYFATSEPDPFEEETLSRWRLREGNRYEYWRAWEQAESLRDRLRSDGLLEATVDLDATRLEDETVRLRLFVQTGKRVRFVSGDGGEIERGLATRLATAWDGYTTREFLEYELGVVATRDLFRRRYFGAEVEVTIEETESETVARVDIEPGPRGRRVRIEFSGNHSRSTEALARALPAPGSEAFHELITTKRPRLAQILELDYASAGHLQAVAGTPTTRYALPAEELIVSIPIVEGPLSTVAEVSIEGADAIDPLALDARVALAPGGAFSLETLAADRAALASLYRREGFPDAAVRAEIEPTETQDALRARYVIDEGTRVVVGAVRVAGNDLTRESVVRREVAIRPGTPLRRDSIQETQKRLYDLGVFRAADIEVSAPVDGSAVRDVIIDVAEGPRATLDYGLRYTTDGTFEVLADAGFPNLFGRAQHARVRALVGTDQRTFRFTYRTPYFATAKLDTNFFVERIIDEDTPEEEGAIPFTDRVWSFTAQQNRPLRPGLGLQWSYSFQRKETEIFFDFPDEPNPIIPLDSGVLTMALVGDRRDNLVQPTRGAFWTLSLQGAPEALGAEIPYLKFFGQLNAFVRLAPGWIWASSYRVGAANSFDRRLLESDRFKAGGPNSVRGFEQGTLGPDDPILERPLGGAAVLVFNQELRFPIAKRLQGVGFYDAGNAFENTSDLSLRDLRHSAGLGARVILPFGLLRFDWARILDLQPDETPWRFVFSLGHAF